MSEGALTAAYAERSEPSYHEKKVKDQKCSVYFFSVYVCDDCRNDRLWEGQCRVSGKGADGGERSL